MEENSYCVYIHTNKINNKKYVGITKTSTSKRWGKNGSGHKAKNHSLFFNAINKYGWDNFEHRIFVENVDKETACYLEVLLIEILRTRDQKYGYNIQKGGQLGNAGVTFSEESKKKMSDAKKGNKLSEEHKLKISKGCKGHKAAVFSDETKEKLRIANIGKHLSEDVKNKISKSLTGITRSEDTIKKIKENNPMKVSVFCEELNMEFISINEAARYVKTPRSNIAKCLTGERKSAGRHPETNQKLHWKKVEK